MAPTDQDFEEAAWMYCTKAGWIITPPLLFWAKEYLRSLPEGQKLAELLHQRIENPLVK